MLTLPGHARLFLYQHPMNMRKSFEGLSAIIEELFPGELYSDAFFIFLNRRKDHMKVLFWDGDGFVIWFKRLEQGTFSWKWGSQTTLDRRSFMLLLEGVIPKRIQKRFSLGK
ncbi:MAG: IS66 family insertion sequence element accessory protein TnpB [Chlamydiales bacterium]|nr:IS66 family insertion sequence element accessory protein TnpB [Chlamydiales bacterium]